VSDERVQFPTAMRGYEKSAVDARIAALEKALEEARAQVEQLDAKTMQIAGELSEAHRQLREAERPTYSGLGSRIEQLLRLRDHLDGCIGCGCLSLRDCPLRNPGDVLACEGPGARLLDP